MRRVFYPAGPSDVLTGFLGVALTGGLLGLVIYGFTTGHVSGGSGWLLVKGLPFLFVALSTMLYRERVLVDLRRRTITAEKWIFILPLSRDSFPVSQVRDVKWELQPTGGFHLMLSRNDGIRFLLAKARLPDEALERELRLELGPA